MEQGQEKCISVVIADCLDNADLYLTYFSLLNQLDKSDLSWEIIIAADGGSTTKWEKMPHTRCLRICTGSPQGTRDAGIRAAKHADILCIESHVIVSDIKTWLEHHSDKKAAISFPARIGEGTEMFNVYGSITDKNGNLWYARHLYEPQGESYPIIQFGHSAFMIDRNFYIAHGGYTNLLKGWGGEEPLLCLKTWMLGGECWMFPDIWHAHYLTPNAHGLSMASDDFKQNFEVVRFVMTGERKVGIAIPQEAINERQRICKGPFGGDLNLLWKYFKERGVCGV